MTSMAELVAVAWRAGEGELPAGRRLVVADPGDDQGLHAVAWIEDAPEWVGGGVDVYEVESTVRWDDLGGPAPVTRLVLVRRHRDLTHEQFAEHWGTVHPPLARAHHPGLARYVQHEITDSLTPDAPPFDGLAELGFASTADLRDRLYGDDADRAAIDADVATFLDVPSGRLLTCTLAPPPSERLRPSGSPATRPASGGPTWTLPSGDAPHLP